MNFQQLKYAVVVAEAGSFREAARRLFMAQSSLSTAIKELEADYQVQIFERTKRGVFITDQGAEFLSYARDVLSQVEVLENRYMGANTKRLFSVSGQHYDFVSETFAQLVAEDEDQGHDYRLLETSTNQVLDDVRTAYSELGILYLNDYNEKVIKQFLSRYDLEFYALGTFANHIFVGNNHPLADYEVVSLEDLKAYPSLSFAQDQGSSQQLIEETFLPLEHQQGTVYVSDRATAINVLVETPAYLLGTGILTSQFQHLMKTIPLAEAQYGQVGYIQRRYQELSVIAQQFITLLQANVPLSDGGNR